jgi:hypothetical protein
VRGGGVGGRQQNNNTTTTASAWLLCAINILYQAKPRERERERDDGEIKQGERARVVRRPNDRPAGVDDFMANATFA